jgi:arylsulfatase A
VGQIVSTLEELGIAENTIVMFTSDNGPHMEGGADPTFFNSSGGLRGVKRDLYEGGIRVPFLVSWPGTVKAGQVSDHISAFWDVLPTVGELSGFKPDKTDGLSFLPELLGREQATHEFLYWEFHEMGGKQSLLKEGWKAVRLNVRENPNGPLELYKLETDPREQKNVADQHPDLVQTFSRMMEEEREVSKDFNFGITTLSGE